MALSQISVSKKYANRLHSKAPNPYKDTTVYDSFLRSNSVSLNSKCDSTFHVKFCVLSKSNEEGKPAEYSS